MTNKRKGDKTPQHENAYTGVLGQGIEYRQLGLLGLLEGDDALQAEVDRQQVEMLLKVPELERALGVIPGDWRGLALALARAHVPGFRVVAPPGRPVEWSPMDKYEWSRAVQALRIASSRSLNDCIEKARKVGEWVDKTAGMSAGALRNHFYDGEKLKGSAMANVSDKAAAYQEMVARE